MTTIIIAITAFIASPLTLFSGFGLGTLLMPVTAFFFPVTIAVALTAFVPLLNNLFKLEVLWKWDAWCAALSFGLPAVAAAAPGAWLLTQMTDLPALTEYSVFGLEADVTPVKLMVGALLIVFAFAKWFSLVKRIEISQRFLSLGGVLSGFLAASPGTRARFAAPSSCTRGLIRDASSPPMPSLPRSWMSRSSSFTAST